MQNPYASFWRRVAAFVIDNLILAIPVWIISGFFSTYYMPQLMANRTQEEMAALFPLLFLGMILANLFFFVLFILYTSIMESSSKQATVGKMALGIKVVDKNGQRLHFWHAVGRNLSKVVSYFVMYFGFFMAAFTRQRQGLHDMMAATFVVNKDYQPGQPLPQETFRTGCLIGSILVILAPFVLLIAAVAIPAYVQMQNAEAVNSPAGVRLLKTQMKALTNTNISADNVMEINGTSFYTQDGDVYAERIEPFSFTVLLPKGETEICCLNDEGDFCESNQIEDCI